MGNLVLQFYPDKPWERSPEDIPGWDQKGGYVCQQKIDGWRTVIILDKDDLRIISRHNNDLTQDVEPELRLEAEQLRRFFSPGSVIDSEWLSRRSCSKEYSLAPKLYIFDVMRNGKQWVKNHPYENRFNLLLQCMDECELKNILLPPEAPDGQFLRFYEDQKNIVFSEGVVIKAKNSAMVADRKTSKKNPQWFKVRYRGASDGKMDMSHLR